MSHVLIIGGLGSIGRRYQAILRHMREGYEVYDTANTEKTLESVIDRATHCIVATPTETHLDVLSKIPRTIPTLVEKPIAKHANFDASRPNTYTVCNYKYVLEAIEAKDNPSISYNYYNTGPDGLMWDCCQLIMLDPNVDLDNKSPVWSLNVDGEWVSYYHLERSYMWMIEDFLYGDRHNLWTLADGLEMSRKVMEYEANRSNLSA